MQQWSGRYAFAMLRCCVRCAHNMIMAAANNAIVSLTLWLLVTELRMAQHLQGQNIGVHTERHLCGRSQSGTPLVCYEGSSEVHPRQPSCRIRNGQDCPHPHESRALGRRPSHCVCLKAPGDKPCRLSSNC